MARFSQACLLVSLFLAEPSHAESTLPSDEAVASAVRKALPLIQKGAAGYIDRRSCFSCHNQGIPILALATARRHGFNVNNEALQAQIQFTANSLSRNRDKYRKGRGQGGQVDTAGYALFALAAGEWKPDDTTSAVAEYLLLYHKDLDHWRVRAKRPPSEYSQFTPNYLAILALQTFGTFDQKDRIAGRIDRVKKWLIKTPAKDTEDKVFRLRALKIAGAEEKVIRKSFRELLEIQREDGGWAQAKDMKSDAYATGTALVALHEAGLGVDDKVYRQGLQFLIQSQLEDGSWHIKSRSKPFQKYFESGFPHKKDQFISTPASGWAATALALACPKQSNAAEKAE